jgi:hypothetical protein
MPSRPKNSPRPAVGRGGEELAHLAALAQHVGDVAGGGEQGVHQGIGGKGTRTDLDRTGNGGGDLRAMAQRLRDREREPQLVVRHGFQARIDRLDRAVDRLAQGCVWWRPRPEPVG